MRDQGKGEMHVLLRKSMLPGKKENARSIEFPLLPEKPDPSSHWE
jgi:hypothetical protein